MKKAGASIVHIWHSSSTNAAALRAHTEGIKANKNAHSGEMKRNQAQYYTMHGIRATEH